MYVGVCNFQKRKKKKCKFMMQRGHMVSRRIFIFVYFPVCSRSERSDEDSSFSSLHFRKINKISTWSS